MTDNSINAKHKIKIIKKILWIIMIVAIILIIAVVAIFLSVDSDKNKHKENKITISEVKKAEDYTWEEYESLEPEEQVLFPDRFENMEEFNNWYENAQNKYKNEGNDLEMLSVDLGNKAPEDFTWEDYMALSPEEQAIFPDCFGSMDEFKKWFDKAQKEVLMQGNTTNFPKIDLGEKKPEDFTWKDYMALSLEEQAIFPDCFGNMDEFKKWFDKAQKETLMQENTTNFIEIDLGEKKAEDFTWEDYKKLTIEEQMLFPDCFESYEDFKDWYSRNNPEK